MSVIAFQAILKPIFPYSQSPPTQQQSPSEGGGGGGGGGSFNLKKKYATKTSPHLRKNLGIGSPSFCTFIHPYPIT